MKTKILPILSKSCNISLRVCAELYILTIFEREKHPVALNLSSAFISMLSFF